MAIEYVGGVTASTIVTGNYTVDLTALTGGLASSPSEGDIVIVSSGLFTYQVDTPPSIVTSGYTTIASLYSFRNLGNSTSYLSAYKFMGATPDTSITIAGEYNAVTGRTTTVSVWRGVDITTPLDVTPTTAILNSSRPNAPAITPITTGAVVVIATSLSSDTNNRVITTSPTGYSNEIFVNATASSNDNYGIMSSKFWISGTEDPGQWLMGSSTNSDTWAAVSIALRPSTAVANTSDFFLLFN